MATPTNMSDDQFLVEVTNLIDGKPSQLKGDAPAAAVTPPVTPEVTPPVETPPVVTPPQKTAEELEAEAAAAAAATPTAEELAAAAAAAPQLDAEGKPIVAAPEVKLGPDGKPLPAEAAPVTPAEPDYKAIHSRLFGTPIRAGGQDITLKDVDEAVSLIQKGVGFHSKMNRLQAELKYVEMLRNNGLLDEVKLSVLIDAQAGNKGAIKKLLDAAKIDPLTFDSAEASTYAPSDHRVTDEQVRFQSVVTDLSESETGKAILQDARGWDQASKAEVYKTPDVLGFLAQQKEMGRYDKIVAEVNRAKLLNQLPVNESFLTSYTRVGQQMMQAGAFGAVTPTPTPTPTPVAQKTITPVVPTNSKQVAAAAPTRSSGPAAKQAVDTSKMSDSEFDKFFKTTYKI